MIRPACGRSGSQRETGRAAAHAGGERHHARSGDPIELAAYLGGGDTFDRAVAGFAEAYADQNERDHRALVEAAASGRVNARTGLPA